MNQIKVLGDVTYNFKIANKKVEYGINEYDNQIFQKEQLSDYFVPTKLFKEINETSNKEVEILNVVQLSDEEIYQVTFFNLLLQEKVKYIYREEIEEGARYGTLFQILD